jgi:hypothetical protein
MVAEAIGGVEQARHDWLVDPGEEILVRWKGQVTRQLDERIEDAANNLFEICATTAVSCRDAMELVLKVDEWEVAVRKYIERQNIAPEAVDPSGGDEFWKPFSWLVALKDHPHRRRRPESPSSLVQQGQTYEKIAKEWGWETPAEEPDTQKVIEEIRSPGTHTSLEGYEHPADTKHYAEVDVRWNERCSSIADRPREPLRGAEPEPTVAPESLDDLLIQSVDLEQILKMKPGETEESVRGRAAELGVSMGVEPTVSTTWRDSRAKHDSRAEERAEQAKVNTYEEIGDDLRLRVALMHEDGHTPVRITGCLRPAFPDLTVQSTVDIIRDQTPPEVPDSDEKPREPKGNTAKKAPPRSKKATAKAS